MRRNKNKELATTFDLNLAPILDIIVSIVPMLLLSVAFIQVKMLETPVPQVVAEAMANANQEAGTVITLKLSKKTGFDFEVDQKGKKDHVAVALKDGQWDMDGLYSTALKIKESNPGVFKLELAPESDVKLEEIVGVMDKVRKGPAERKIAFVDPKSGQKIETDLMFPDVIFSNVVGE